MPASIFVSYSHKDVGLVQPVVRLLRATEDLVFQDLDGIKPGRKWRREMEEALYTAQLFILFWCYHSSRSAEVRKEYQLVLTTGKDVLPVLLDTTPLPQQLNEFQWVDFRHLVGSAHRSYRHWATLTVVLMVMVGFSLFFARPPLSQHEAFQRYSPIPSPLEPPPEETPHHGPPATDTPQHGSFHRYSPLPLPIPSPLEPPPGETPHHGPPATDTPGFARVLIVLGLIALGLIAILVATIWVFVTWIGWKARRRRSRAAAYHQHIAEELQTELHRRGIGSA